MTKTQVEVITSVQRRRRWSRAEKERIVAAAIEPGAVASEVARAAGIHASQLFRWRQRALWPGASRSRYFRRLRLRLDRSGLDTRSRIRRERIEIEFATGARMRITGPVDASTVRAMIAALAKTKRRRDDPGPERRAGLAGDRPHRHAQGLRRPGAAGAGDAQARSARRTSVRVPRPARRADQGVCGMTARACACYAKRLERGRFIWPSPADGMVTITPAQLGYLARRDRLADAATHVATASGRLSRDIVNHDARLRVTKAAICDCYLRDDAAADSLPDDVEMLKAMLHCRARGAH